MKPVRRPFAPTVLFLAVSAGMLLAAGKPTFEQDFAAVPVGDLPAEFMVLDGQFTVKEEAGNRFVELPGSPLDSYGVLFGANTPVGLSVSARIQATKSGRKFPTFAVGLNGVGGYKLRVAPAKGGVELLRGDEVQATAPFKWTSGEWTRLRLTVVRKGSGVEVEGRVWSGDAEPTAPTVVFVDAQPMPAGKAGFWGLPFSGTPIRFDDLRLTPAP